MPKSKSKKDAIFFGKENKKRKVNKAEEMLQLYVKYIPQIRKIMRDEQERETSEILSDGQIMGQMYDFYKDYGNTVGVTPVVWDGMGRTTFSVNADGTIPSSDKRKEATPLSVMNELERVPTPFDCENLDEKISTLKDKSKLLNQRYAKAQIDGLTKRLENRKKYRENVEFYSSLPNTTDEKIDNLLAKYKLVMKESDLFVPTFPKEAVDIMKKYTEETKKVTTEKLVFYVIAEAKDFEKKYKKLDPILLVQSPFGFFWQILGAWDKEMILLHEL